MYRFVIKISLQEIPYAVKKDTKYEIMVAPELIHVFDDAVASEKLKSRLVIEDYSKLVFS